MKLMIWVICASFLLIGCAREVTQVEEHYQVTPNVVSTTPMQPSVQPSYHSSVQPSYEQPSYEQPAPPQPTATRGEPSWLNEVVRETGQGAIPPKYINEPGRGRLMAEQAARADARRKLLERIGGLRLDSQTTVNDFVTESDRINTEASGFIKGSTEVGKNFDGEVANVTMELKLYNVYMYMREKRIYYE